ncbi:MAG: glutamate synthase subunit beta [Thermodesulfobacteriota bacterium]|nr:glutamate synthase subunit beta [Thermodesulfobacteriota bacterium]
MQKFVETNRHDPEKVEPGQRLSNFDEIYQFFNNRQVRKQSERCVQCGDPFCAAVGCPLQNHIPQWLEAVAARDLERAFRLSNESSPFPEILGRICPQGDLCEGACTLDDGFGAITIGAIEASITDLAFAAGLQLPFPGIQHSRKVAIVGSGPAGISCAHFLLRAGIGVEMYEQADRPGGLLTYGIPGFKLDKKIVEGRFKLLRKAGLQLHLQQKIGHDIELDELIEQNDAVFVGIGATKGRRAGIGGEELAGVISAMDYLIEKQKQLFDQTRNEKFSMVDKRVVVIGGGDTAMDCLRTAIRDGASQVSCLYRRNEANMPGSPKEFQNAIEEGVEFCFNISPREIRCETGGLLCIEVENTRLGETAEDGRQRVEIVPNTEHCISADVVILALGFDVATFPGFKNAGIKTNKWGEVQIDLITGATCNPKVYSGGDCHRGADLVVTAAADGRKAALAIMRKLLS